MPRVIDEFITKTGTVTFGSLTVEVVEKDGKVFCNSSWAGGFDFTHDPEAQWLVYVHTTDDIWAYGGGGWLSRGTFRIDSDGTFHGKSSRLTIGERWAPSAELLASMPQALIDKIDEIVKKNG